MDRAGDSSSSSRILILLHESRRVAIALPSSLHLALSAATKHFPRLPRPLHLTLDLPQVGGVVEITESVWKTDLIQGHSLLTLEVQGSRVEAVKEAELGRGDEGESAEQSETGEAQNEQDPVGTEGVHEEQEEGEEKGYEKRASSGARSRTEESTALNRTVDLDPTLPRSVPSNPNIFLSSLSIPPPAPPTAIVVPKNVVIEVHFSLSNHIKQPVRMNLLPTHRTERILDVLATQHGIEGGKRGLRRLRLLHDGWYICNELVGKLVDDEYRGTESSPVMIDVYEEMLGGG